MTPRKISFFKSTEDAVMTGFFITTVPIIYIFQMFVVLPVFHQLWSKWYLFHFITGTYIVWNLCANFFKVTTSDNSVKAMKLPTNNMEVNWRSCSSCDSLAPPRSWHCDICNVCILKRDHHCRFVNCCIGHHNLRYFVAFLFHLFIGSAYFTYYSAFFVVQNLKINSWKAILEVFFPMVSFFYGLTLKKYLYFLIFLITLFGVVFSGNYLCYQLQLILKGVVAYEHKKNSREYDLGKKRNLTSALGNRWYLIWVSPCLRSELTCDGISWDKKPM